VGTANPGELIEAERIALVGADCRIAPGAQVAQGARLEPGTVAE
jgi:hypothetical protein